MSRWWIFISERFPLASHFLMIFLFVLAHFFVVASHDIKIDPYRAILVLLAITIFFFKMRLYDEIKDYEVDKKVNKDRPLPRGLVSFKEVKGGILVCLIVEFLLFSPLGWKALLVFALAAGYSLLMYKEFFVGTLIRPHLTTYALLHTIVTVPMGMAIFSGVTDLLPIHFSPNSFYFLFSSWFLFNIFEFGRKTYASSEERGQIESYSKIFGIKGAVFLVLSMALCSIVLISKAQGFFSFFQIGIFLTLVGVGGHYAFTNKPAAAKLYRAFSSGYIVLFYVCFITELYLGAKTWPF